MNLWEIVDPNAEIVKSLSEHQDNPMVALVETSTRFNMPMSEVISIYKSHLTINESSISKKKTEQIVEIQSPPKELRDYKTSTIQGSPDINWKDDINALLLKHGYKLLGKGSFGRVYKNDKQDKVLKVFKKDDKFLEWIKFCQAHPNNKWLPKFKSKLVRLKDNPPIYAIQIEELTPYDGSKKGLDATLHYVFSFMAQSYNTLFKDGKFDPTDDHSDFVMKGYAPVIEKLYDEELDTVLKYLYKHRDDVDLSEQNNLLYRGNQPVLMDPLA